MKSNCVKPEWKGRAKCSVCEVRNIVLFSGLAEADLDSILQPIDNLHASERAVLYEQDCPATHVYTIRSGLVKLTVDLANGGQRIVRLLRPGDVAGIEAVLGGPYRHHAVVLHEADVCRIPVEVVCRLDETNPRLHRSLLERWQRAVDEADRFIAALSTGSVEARLARLLLKLACEQGPDLAFVPSRQDLGALLGVTVETVSRAMAEFKRRGLVYEDKGRFAACDRQRLEAIAHG